MSYYQLAGERKSELDDYVLRKKARAMTLGEYERAYLKLHDIHLRTDYTGEKYKSGNLLYRAFMDGWRNGDEIFGFEFKAAELVDLLLDKVEKLALENERLKNAHDTGGAKNGL